MRERGGAEGGSEGRRWEKTASQNVRDVFSFLVVEMDQWGGGRRIEDYGEKATITQILFAEGVLSPAQRCSSSRSECLRSTA